ncbi:MAG: phosphate acyltransferase PlsX [Eubacteriales bacterium]|nr:phosphate acyltransferase PlsX [Eubacteriales bacterium]
MKIIVDAMGGDFAPLAPVKGALLAHEKFGTEIVLTGRTEEILRSVRECGRETLPAGMEIVNAEQVVEICDDPSTAFKQKKDSSLTVGLNLLRDGQADGFVCAGSTGALLAGATLVVKRIRGLRRAALAPTIPTATGKAVLIDCGANAECTVEYLLQFAYLGSYYAEKVLGVERPRIGLLNIGAEESKGDTLRRETYQKLKEAGGAGHLNFVGNVEAKEAMMGACDVIVADGYSGNIMLKSIEGTGKLMAKELKATLMKNAGTKVAALLLKSALADFKKMLDPNEVGGTALLGISKPVVKAHGSSNEVAFCNAIRQASEVAQSGIIADIEANIDKMRLGRDD